MYSYKPTGDRVFVKFDSATVDVKVLPTGHKIYLPSAKGRIEQFATVVGTVYSDGVRSKLGLQSGEKVACAYQVVSNYELRNDGVTVYRNYYVLPDDSRIWKAEANQIMAVYRNGKWESVGDWVLMTELHEHTDIPIFGMNGTSQSMGQFQNKEEQLALEALIPPVLVKGKGRTLDGQIAYFEEGYRSVYEIDNTKYIILPKRLIVAYAS